MLPTALKNSFEEVIKDNPGIGKACYSVLKSFGYSFEEAEQEGFVRLFLHMNEGNRLDIPGTWLRTVLYRKEVDRGRKAKLVDLLPLDGKMAFDERPQDYDYLLVGLTEDQKELILMYYIDDYSLRKIGDILGITENAAKIRVCRVRKKARRLINGR